MVRDDEHSVYSHGELRDSVAVGAGLQPSSPVHHRSPRDRKLPSIERTKQLQTLREGLALFAAVAWIDVKALIYLLKTKGFAKSKTRHEVTRL